MLASFLVSSAMASGWTVTRGDLTFQGYGSWVASDGSSGLYTTYEKTWPQCYHSCMTNKVCTGVEFSMKPNGGTTCEIHRGQYKGYKKGKNRTTVWTK